MSQGCSLSCLWVTINLSHLKVNKYHTYLLHLCRPRDVSPKLLIFINFRLPARIFCNSLSFFSKIRLVANLYVSYWAWHLINTVFTDLMSSDKFLSFLWHILISCNYEWSDLKRLLSHKITVNLYNLYLQGQNVFLWLEKLKGYLSQFSSHIKSSVEHSYLKHGTFIFYQHQGRCFINHIYHRAFLQSQPL